MSKLIYKPFSLLVSVLGGMVAGAIFKQVWRVAAREEEAPSATDARRRWPEILVAAALQGAIFAAVKADDLQDRAAALTYYGTQSIFPGPSDFVCVLHPQTGINRTRRWSKHIQSERV